MPRCIAIRHLPFESLDAWEEPLARRFDLDYCDAPQEGVSRDLDPDLLVVLGAPLGANDGREYPFLDDTIALLRERLSNNRPTLGICLGAQLMARALGTEVHAGDMPEIGWSKLDLTPDGMLSPLRHFDGVPVFHWHSDTFDMPERARLLAGTPACAHQAFDIGSNILGLQFHPEVSARNLETWYVGHYRNLQSRSTPGVRVLREESYRHEAALAEAGRACLEQWLDEAGFSR
ncbi:MAG: glutamine amidotransferase [Gammaproteobacteria bacterium]|nr:glutamine amidotransferase [Gammaproteobacteria bacterium]